MSKLLIIKRDRRELNHLIKEISEGTAAAADRLKEYARNDASLNLEQIALPPGEEATRKAIKATKKKQLLGLRLRSVAGSFGCVGNKDRVI